MSEMHGGCSDFAWDLSEEFRALEAGPRLFRAAADPATLDQSRLELAGAYRVRLHPVGSVRFAREPERDWAGGGGFAGSVAFRASDTGAYRVSAGRKVWIDAVSGGAFVTPDAFEMQSGCDSLFKSVAFSFDAGREVVLQLNGESDTVDLVVSRWKEGPTR